MKNAFVRKSASLALTFSGASLALTFSGASMILLSCGSQSSKDTSGSNAEVAVPEAMPSDSTGAQTQVSLGFGLLEKDAVSLELAEETAAYANITLDGGIVVSDARVSIAAIKIKSDKEPSEIEKSHEKEMNAKAKERVKAEEAEDASADAEIAKEVAVSLDLVGKAPDKASKDKIDEKKKQVRTQHAGARKEKDTTELDAEAKADPALKWKGPFVYDLVKKSVSPALPAVQLTDGSYRRIDFQTKPNRSVDAADPLLNNTFYVGGTVLLNGKQVPFKVSYHVAENIRLAGDAGAKMEASVENKLVIAFDVKSWFAGVDFSKAEIDADGNIVVDKTHNKGTLKMIRMNIKKAAHFGKGSAEGKLKGSEAAGKGAAVEEAETPDAT